MKTPVSVADGSEEMGAVIIIIHCGALNGMCRGGDQLRNTLYMP
jgi:hypothetical protein